MPRICINAALLKFLSTARGLNMGPFLIIVVKLSSYKDGNVGNLRKFEYLYDYFRHSRNAWKYNLTSNLRFFRPVMNINNCRAVFDFKQMGLFLICQVMTCL